MLGIKGEYVMGWKNMRTIDANHPGARCGNTEERERKGCVKIGGTGCRECFDYEKKRREETENLPVLHKNPRSDADRKKENRRLWREKRWR